MLGIPWCGPHGCHCSGTHLGTPRVPGGAGIAGQTPLGSVPWGVIHVGRATAQKGLKGRHPGWGSAPWGLSGIQWGNSENPWVGRDLEAHLAPTPCQEEGHLPLDQTWAAADLQRSLGKLRVRACSRNISGIAGPPTSPSIMQISPGVLAAVSLQLIRLGLGYL